MKVLKHLKQLAKGKEFYNKLKLYRANFPEKRVDMWLVNKYRKVEK